MHRDEAKELAERIEAAEGKTDANWRGWEGWQLQREIALAIGWTIETDARGGEHWTDQNGEAAQDPMFLCSLDAAMTLVPEGWTRLLDNTDGKEVAELYPHGPIDDAHIQRGSHPTSLALALAAAALRARSQGGIDNAQSDNSR